MTSAGAVVRREWTGAADQYFDHLDLLDALAEAHEEDEAEDAHQVAILEGRRDPVRPVHVRRPNRVASASARRRYIRAASRRHALKLWSALRTCRGGRARGHRRPRAHRRVVRGGVGDDPDGPPGHPAPGQRGPRLGNKNTETPAASAPLSRSTP